MRLPKGIRPTLRQAQERTEPASEAHDAFLLLLRAHGLPAPKTEVLFAPPRKYRADYCWLDRLVIVEREGGLWSSGRAQSAHGRPFGILRDMEKLNLAQALGFRYFRFTPQQLDSGLAIGLIRPLLMDGPR